MPAPQPAVAVPGPRGPVDSVEPSRAATTAPETVRTDAVAEEACVAPAGPCDAGVEEVAPSALQIPAPRTPVPDPVREPARPADVPAPRTPSRPEESRTGESLDQIPCTGEPRTQGRRAGGRHAGPTERGRHRRTPVTGAQLRAGAVPVDRAFQVVARVGSVTTLAAMLVLATAVAGLTDGHPPTGEAAQLSIATLP
ncbi:hypothetical protein [Pseudonocardia phyllosphaerae]|uniref:hypothetical protein n=1 Tax=Pseudonocardia phyllosphaerae TaxID=3390502 RepID=UPI00397C0372